MTRLLIALLLSMFAFVHVAHADDPAERAAKRHYERGQKLFNLQKFDEALDQFQKAYDAKPIPEFLFNIGQCHRNLGDYEAAVFSFKKYLKLAPDAPNKEQVEQLIEELESKKDQGTSERFGLVKKKERPIESGEGKPVYKKWWFWTGVAVVAVGAVGIYALTRDNTPDTELGAIDFPK
ncbi:MAG TPA: tetratricopeptide repeat protein [Kofleriaceae bacterium]|nr:tetratricopeptide repeat protein [Kofleriaceae bacterium]